MRLKKEKKKTKSKKHFLQKGIGERDQKEDLSELPIGRGGLVLIVIRRKLLLQESTHVTSLLSTGGLGLLVILSLECERLLLLLKREYKYKQI